MKIKNCKLKIIKSAGFSLIEFLVVTAIIAILTTIVTVNFRSQRAQQETMAAANELVSKIRELQNFILAGRVIRGTTESATAYLITFNSNAGLNGSYTIDYRTPTVATTTGAEIVPLPANVTIGQILQSGVPTNSISIQIYSPFGKMTVSNNANTIAQIRLDHVSGYTRTVTVDGISGKIGQ
ncbi:MAG: prepilin-type N-terminal cleavage/methylation domain-containing protein [Candidatus Doudnabacteria bacterium]|nr:prepilin-type N-terminal cleavage/methylation domain-containing protein [Candidatus Doudnabacteria bacterium]